MSDPSNCGPLGCGTNSPDMDRGTNNRNRLRPPVPTGQGRGGRGSNPLKVALTPEEMWRQVQNKRGFESSRGGKGDTRHVRPATIQIDPKGKGTPVGKGFETVGAIQVLDKNGKQVDFGCDIYRSGGPEKHAEAKALRALSKHVREKVPGGRLIVVVEKEPCPHCVRKLKGFAQRHDLAGIDVHVPYRESLVKPGQAVTFKTAARTSFQGGRVTKLRKLYSIKFPGASMVGLRRSKLPFRTGITGSITNLFAGIVTGILTGVLRSQMEENLRKAPKLNLDRRGAEEYLRDPNSKRGLKYFALLKKDFRSFGKKLQEHHLKVVGQTIMELRLLALSTASYEERLKFLTQIEDQLDIYENDLFVVYDNLNDAINLEDKAFAAAKAAEDLDQIIHRVLVLDYLVKIGFSIEEITTISSNLTGLSKNIRKTFSEMKELNKLVLKLLYEEGDLSKQVNKIYWHEIFLSGKAK